MATYYEIVEGMRILAKYEDKGLNTSIGGAEHDIIYAGAGGGCGDPVLPGEDTPHGKRLQELGWHLDSETESWARFV